MSKNKQIGVGTPFNFLEINNALEDENNTTLIHQIKERTLDGFIAKSILSKQEVEDVLLFLRNLSEDFYMTTPSGKIFPRPFAILGSSNEKIDEYESFNKIFEQKKLENPAIKNILKKLDDTIKFFASNFNVSCPTIKLKDIPVSPGTFRYLFKNKGGLYVHSGNYFQEQNEFFYEMVKNDIDMNDQLSYFIVLQNSEQGGELTLYDLIWEKGQTKTDAHNNDFVILKDGTKVFVETLKKLKLKPNVGDILIFYGGYIWHRVEDIRGETPRVTLGGFLNFSKDEKELLYWS